MLRWGVCLLPYIYTRPRKKENSLFGVLPPSDPCFICPLGPYLGSQKAIIPIIGTFLLYWVLYQGTIYTYIPRVLGEAYMACSYLYITPYLVYYLIYSLLPKEVLLEHPLLGVHHDPYVLVIFVSKLYIYYIIA